MHSIHLCFGIERCSFASFDRMLIVWNLFLNNDKSKNQTSNSSSGPQNALPGNGHPKPNDRAEGAETAEPRQKIKIEQKVIKLFSYLIPLSAVQARERLGLDFKFPAPSLRCKGRRDSRVIMDIVSL